MNKYASGIAIIALILGLFAVGGVSAQVVGVAEEKVVSMPAMPAAEQPGNFTKLEILPRYGNFRLQPGESKEMTITIKNKEKKVVSLKPNIVIPPFSEYIMDKEWITVTPASADIPSEGSQKFTLKASVPKDASAGFYNAQVAFTDEEIPSPYPQPVPNYVHSFSLSMDVWTPPIIQITTPYISDQLEAGKEYDYEIKLKNTGDKEVAIAPKISQENYMYGPYGTAGSAFPDSAITITAPKSVPAGTTESVKIHVKVPADSKGMYNGMIDLGIEDPSIQRFGGSGGVNLNFNVWKQPTEPFVKSFTLKQPSPVTIEVSSSYFGDLYKLAMLASGMGTGNAKEPSFEIYLEGGTGKAELKLEKTVIKGGVSMGGQIPPWEVDSTGIYQDIGTQHIETYTANIPAGEWKLKVLPRDTDKFEYTITIGE
ncbi:Uncharacterised protein [uncultured archaeon]|nr:Uncharacterised protein [uncultured archaeon]